MYTILLTALLISLPFALADTDPVQHIKADQAKVIVLSEQSKTN